MQKERRIALLIDCENVSYRHSVRILSELDKLGTVCCKRAYGDWRGPLLKGWSEQLITHAIEPVHHPKSIKGKSNSTDIRLTLDAMDLLYQQSYGVNSIALVSNDSDFISLNCRLRRGGFYVISFGEVKAIDELRQSVDLFLGLPFLNPSEPSIAELKICDERSLSQIKHGIGQVGGRDGWAHLGALGNYLLKSFGLTVNSLGCSKLSDYFKGQPENFQLKQDAKGYFYVANAPSTLIGYRRASNG